MKEKGKNENDRRKQDRRKPLSEDEVRKILEEGKLFDGDRRNYKDRRKNENKEETEKE